MKRNDLLLENVVSYSLKHKYSAGTVLQLCLWLMFTAWLCEVFLLKNTVNNYFYGLMHARKHCCIINATEGVA